MLSKIRFIFRFRFIYLSTISLAIDHTRQLQVVGQVNILQLSHDISVAGVVEEHVVELLHGLHLLPLALCDQLLVDLVVVDEEVVEAFVAVGNVPSNQTSGLHNSQ